MRLRRRATEVEGRGRAGWSLLLGLLALEPEAWFAFRIGSRPRGNESLGGAFLPFRPKVAATCKNSLINRGTKYPGTKYPLQDSNL